MVKKELANFDIQAKATIGRKLVTTITRIPKRPNAPPIIRPADMRSSTYKVLGKRTQNSIVIGRGTGVPSSHALMPHFGNFRNQSGFLSGLDPQVNVRGKLAPRPDSSIPFMFTKIPQPK